MIISKEGLEFIKKWEGCPTDKKGICIAYKDCTGVLTIGYGMIESDYKITGIHVKNDTKITKYQAEKLFEELIKKKYAPDVDKWMYKYNFSQKQYDSLLSFHYNTGAIDQLLNDGKRTIKEISNKILEYNKSKGLFVQGLYDRRVEEKKMFDIGTKNGEKYKGTFPVLPDSSFGVKRKYYQIGDGVNQLRKYPTQIKRLQKTLEWALDISLKSEYGKYMYNTEKAVFKLQEKAGIPKNGKYGSLCIDYIKSLRK